MRRFLVDRLKIIARARWAGSSTPVQESKRLAIHIRLQKQALSGLAQFWRHRFFTLLVVCTFWACWAQVLNLVALWLATTQRGPRPLQREF